METNPMREIRIEKVTLNIGAGKNQDTLKKGLKLLKNITNGVPITTVTQKRLPAWGLRPGLPIGCKITLRKKRAVDIVPRLLEARTNTLKEDHFDEHGNVSFGIHEYIDIGSIKYDPEIGIMGLQVCVTLERPGFRIKRRSDKKPLGKKQRITKEESIVYFKKKFNVRIGEEE